MSTVVLDASAGLEVVLRGSRSQVYEELMLAADLIISVDLYKAETANVYWKYHKFGDLTVQEAKEYWVDTIALVQHFADTFSLFDLGFELAVKHSISVYDALYLALAKQTAACLLTLDKKLRSFALIERIAVS